MFDNLSYRGYNAKYEKAQERSSEIHKGSSKIKIRKRNECYICGTDSQLDFHHFYSLSSSTRQWLKVKTKERPEHYTDEYIVIWRDEFIEDNWAELYEHTVTICHAHHMELHKVYGRNPGLGTATKQMRWVDIQREKHGMV